MELKPVGIVRSLIKSTDEMPVQGVNAEVLINEEYFDATLGLEGNSHIALLCWLHEADRTVLRANPKKISSTLPEKGVFAMRSPARPNPISLTVVRLQAIIGHRLMVSNLDVIDGTPVVDIKPYQAGWDCVFSAVNPDRLAKIKKMKPGEYQESLIREALNYHDERCVGLAMAVRMAMVATNVLDCEMRSPRLAIIIGKNHCISDSLIGITGARLGSHRLLYNLNPKLSKTGDTYSIMNDEKTIIFKVRRFMKSFDTILDCDVNDLFVIEII